jgi:hypothetical protein
MCGIAGMIDWRAATPADTLRAARRLWEISERQCAVSGRSAEARARLLYCGSTLSMFRLSAPDYL